jgi:hypothetical protein
MAKRSRIAIGTIRRMESFAGPINSRTSTLSQVQQTLERAGIQFLNDESPRCSTSGWHSSKAEIGFVTTIIQPPCFALLPGTLR